MPFPLLAVAFVLVSAGTAGAGVGAKGVYDMAEAKAMERDARSRYHDDLDKYQVQEDQTRCMIEKYGRFQLRVQATTVSEWAGWLETNERKVRWLEHAIVDGVEISVPDLPELNVVIAEATELLAGATSAAVSAVAAQQVALAGVRALAAAGTGAAISSLSGAAAEGATLAWLGGGTIAAGGGGVAAGTLVLSGVAIAPALLIGGITLAIQGEKARTQAQEYESEVNCAVEEMHTNAKLLERLERRTVELDHILTQLNSRARCSLQSLSELDFDPSGHAHEFQQTALLMRALTEVLDTPLLDADGNVSEASATLTERYAA
jgi:hypothetical protein